MEKLYICCLDTEDVHVRKYDLFAGKAPFSNMKNDKTEILTYESQDEKSTRSENDLEFTFELILKYNIIDQCYKKAEHFINLASNSLSIFPSSTEKKVLENLTTFSLERSF